MNPVLNDELRFTPIFVSGSPRSGTTLLNSLVCSSKSVNRHIQECSYLFWSMHPLKMALSTFEKSQGHYFSSREQLYKFHGSLVKQILSSIWTDLDCPENLCLKNPNLVIDYRLIAEMIPVAKFIAIIRDPKDIISSRLEAEKRGNGNFELTDTFLQQEIQNINDIHQSIIDFLNYTSTKNLHVIEYENLVQQKGLEELRAFLDISDIDVEAVWSRSQENMHSKDSQWITSLYGQKVQSSSIGRFKQVLNEETIATIDQLTSEAYISLKQELGN